MTYKFVVLGQQCTFSNFTDGVDTNDTSNLIGIILDFVIPPLITEVKSRVYAAASNRLGGIPPIAVCGRSLL